MRKILLSAVAASAMVVVPALASKPATHPTHPNNAPTQPNPKAKGRCKAKHVVGYNASGTFVSFGTNWAQTGGTATPTDFSDDTYSGDITVHVTRANHKAPTGTDQTFTLANGKVSFYDASNDNTPDAPVAGDTVRLHGTIGHAPKKCNLQGPVITVKRVSFTQAVQPTAPTS